MQIKLDDGTEIILDKTEFRRVLKVAQHALSQLERVEGSSFPSIDRRAAKLITHLQFKDKELI